VKYRLIEAHHQEFEVKAMCQVLAVSRSGYYAWRKRVPSPRTRANQELVAQIRQIHAKSRQTYGSPRVHAALRAQGVCCNRKRVERLMRLHGIQAKQRRRYKRTTQRHPTRPAAPNLLARDFTAEKPNQKWVADITYISTFEGWLYLAAVLDIFSRRVVGWSMSQRIKTDLVADALQMALNRRETGADLLHHSDRGSQYTSKDYQRLLQQHGITVSMSGVGNAYDNAVMESFFATLKTECVDRRYATRNQARLAIFEFIEAWYNRQRLHSSLGFLSPHHFESRHSDSLRVHQNGGRPVVTRVGGVSGVGGVIRLPTRETRTRLCVQMAVYECKHPLFTNVNA
jgi:putative transposase